MALEDDGNVYDRRPPRHPREWAAAGGDAQDLAHKWGLSLWEIESVLAAQPEALREFYLRDLIALTAELGEVVQGAHLRHWAHQPNPAFRGEKPVAMLRAPGPLMDLQVMAYRLRSGEPT